MNNSILKLMARVLTPTVLAAVLFGQILGNGNFNLLVFILNFIVAFISASVVLALLPLDKIGGYLIKNNVNPKSLKFEVLMNVIINIFFAVVIGFVIIFLNIVIIQKLPISLVVPEFLKGLIPMFIVTFIVSFFAFRYHNKLEKNK